MKRNYWLDNGDGKGPMHAAFFENYDIAFELAEDVGAEVRTGPDRVSLMQLMEEADLVQVSCPRLHYGQCMYTALYALAPDIANLVCATKDDPYCDDTRIDAMIQRFFKERG